MPMKEKDFYRHPEVIKRILEYCGVPNWITQQADIGYPQNYGALSKSRNLQELGKLMSSMYLVEYGLRVPTAGKYRTKEVWQMGQILDKTADIFRSVHDEDNEVCVIDVERVCHGDAGANYRDMVGLFWDLEPFHQAMMSVYRSLGITPLVVATGQGYHYGFRVPKNERAYGLLQSIGFVSEDERKRNLYRRYGSKRRRILTDAEAWAYDGWGKLAEYIAILAMKRAARYNNTLPVVIGDQWAHDGKVISLDLSANGDPKFMRDIRTPYSFHQKHKVCPDKVGRKTAKETSFNVATPRFTPCNGHELSLDDLFRLRRDNYYDAACYASSITTDLPVMSWGVEKAIKKYLKSDVHAAHVEFDQGMEMFRHPNYEKRYSEKYNELKNIRLHPNLVADINSSEGKQLNPDVIRAVFNVYIKHHVHPADMVALMAGKAKYYKVLGGYKTSPVKRMTGWIRPFYVQHKTKMSHWRRTVNW